MTAAADNDDGDGGGGYNHSAILARVETRRRAVGLAVGLALGRAPDRATASSVADDDVHVDIGKRGAIRSFGVRSVEDIDVVTWACVAEEHLGDLHGRRHPV
jgi:hypothetical protein